MFSRKMMLTRIIIAIFVVILFGTQAYAELYMSISGAIKDATTGKGIAGVEVVAGDLTTKKNYSAVTDNNGIYYIKLVPAGEYTLYAHPSAKYVFKPYTKTVTVEKGKNVVNANFEMPLGGAVSGTIYQSDGITPLVNASVFVLTNKGAAMSSTDSNGKVLITGLVPEYLTKLRIMTFGYGMIEADNIPITAGIVTEGVNFRLLPSSSGVSGIISTYDSVGIPISDAVVVFLGLNGACVTVTDSNGNFNIKGLPEGTYQAIVYKVGFGNKIVNNITIAKNAITKKNFQLSPQPLHNIAASDEQEQINNTVFKFAINDPDLPYVSLNVVSTNGCICSSLTFSTAIGIGFSMAISTCRCSLSCGSSACISVKQFKTICSCFGLGISGGLSAVQACWNPPSFGISSGFQLDVGVISLSGDCLGIGPGGGAGLYYCSCETMRI